MRKLAAAVAGAMLASTAIVFAEPVPRAGAPAGSVIARKAGEEVNFIDISGWRTVDIHQDLLPGDVLRTNALGNLAVLFSDNTQVRLGRNTTMVVKSVSTGGADSVLELQSGNIWARAERGGEGVMIETAAAAAAIRGTDWTMSVDASGRTSLIVLEGVVELSNKLGSVRVTRGEAASASIGQAPTKTVIVDPDDREQMLFYISLRNGFVALPVSSLSSADMRRERARIAAIPEAARRAEDWLTQAEVALSYDGRAAAKHAAEQARAFRLTPGQKARLDLVDAMIAAAEQRYGEAIPLFERALPRLGGSRRSMAAYGGYFARSLANPDRVEQPPNGVADGPFGALAEAWTAGFLHGIKAGIDVLKRAEQRYANDPTLPAARAQFALLLDDREQVKQAVDRALSLDPDDPTALEARAHYLAGFESKLDSALEDLTRAAALAPGSSSIWNALGNVQSARGADREAEAAFKKAIELDPEDPVSHANLAIFYMDHSRLAQAKAKIETAMAKDPAFDIGLVARGRYHVQTGEIDKAIQDLLAGSTANPAYAQALLLLAAAYYENGEWEPAAQALENADRLDPNDPVTSTVAAMIAIDQYDSDKAIESAQEALRRTRARGGDYEALSASLSEGSTLNDAYRFQGLDAWGRYYGDAVFDPFNAAGYIDQAVAGSANPFINDLNYGSVPIEPSVNGSAFSSYFQGLLLDPMMISNRARGLNLLRSPFVETTVGGGFVAGDEQGWNGDLEIQGHQVAPIPWSFYGKVDGLKSDSTRDITLSGVDGISAETEALSGIGYFAAEPTPYDRVLAFAQFNRLNNEVAQIIDPAILEPVERGRDISYSRDGDAGTGGVAWSHTFGYRNVANAAFFVTAVDAASSRAEVSETIFGPFGLELESATKQQAYIGALSHSYGFGDATLRYGLEGGYINTDQTSTLTAHVPCIPGSPDPCGSFDTSEDSKAEAGVGRTYADLLYAITPTLEVEGALFGTFLQGDNIDVSRLDPRFGAAWAPVEGHWLRAGYMRDASALLNSSTLSPVDLLGLQSNQVPLSIDGYSDTFIARWDAEWTNHFFTAIDYQHQELHDLAIDVPTSLTTIDVSRGRIDRVSATANLWLTHGFGAFATAAYTDSENKDDGPAAGDPLPFIPEWGGRVGITYVNPANLRFTLAATYVGERTGNIAGTELDAYWTADAFLTWEPLDKRFELELAAYNLFDEEFEVAPNLPGWGRTFTGSLKMRF
jgi:tetratricopeptide (TPR) repeat protein